MLHFIARKPFLKDLIPDHHIDIHSHLLPGIDDGAKTPDDTLDLIADLKQLGFGQFITTPHVMRNVWNNTAEGIRGKLSETNEMLASKDIGITLSAGAEYLMDGNFVALFQKEKLLTLKQNYVLVEMSYINPPIQLYDIIFDLQVAGYKPVLAHPERYLFYHHNFSEYQKLKHSGCLFQLNLLSAVGYYGADVAETAKKLLKGGMIDYVGSDVHHQNHVAAFSKRLIFRDTIPLKEAFANNSFFGQ
ncbi:MAG TPA: CpsB/CapC family capsule biosynthesis tyrosine phosphatase [Flavobacterium sp.]|nr:CpsB/CapC family capsule biosynthesis tyrosine phosphatase [Flavobacterium sp.]